MTEDELRTASLELARKVSQLRELTLDHAEERAEMKRARDKLRAQIDAMAQTIEQHHHVRALEAPAT